MKTHVLVTIHQVGECRFADDGEAEAEDTVSDGYDTPVGFLFCISQSQYSRANLVVQRCRLGKIKKKRHT